MNWELIFMWMSEWVNELVSEWVWRSEGGRERVFYWAHCSRKQYDVDIFLSYRLNDTWFIFIQFGAIVYVLCTCGLSNVTKPSLHRPILLCFTFLSCLVFLFRFKAIFILWMLKLWFCVDDLKRDNPYCNRDNPFCNRAPDNVCKWCSQMV